MILEGIILLLSVPTGFLIAYLANDELVIGRKYFIWLIAISCIAGVIGLFYNISISWLAGFVIISTAISYGKSFDAHWTRKRM